MQNAATANGLASDKVRIVSGQPGFSIKRAETGERSRSPRAAKLRLHWDRLLATVFPGH
jgi:hypothetical protein